MTVPLDALEAGERHVLGERRKLIHILNVMGERRSEQRKGKEKKKETKKREKNNGKEERKG